MRVLEYSFIAFWYYRLFRYLLAYINFNLLFGSEFAVIIQASFSCDLLQSITLTLITKLLLFKSTIFHSIYYIFIIFTQWQNKTKTTSSFNCSCYPTIYYFQTIYSISFRHSLIYHNYTKNQCNQSIWITSCLFLQSLSNYFI